MSFAGLLENKLTIHKIREFVDLFDKNWECVYNNKHQEKGRISVMWDKNQWYVSINHKNERFITCLVHNKVGTAFFCTMVYVQNQANRTHLWDCLKHQANKYNLP